MTFEDAKFILDHPELREAQAISAARQIVREQRAEIVEERIIGEIRERRLRGIAKYGVGMERTDLTLRQWLQHAKEECLDQAIYLEKCIEEIDRAITH